MIEKIRTTEQGLYNEHGTFLGTMPKDTDSLTLANKINELVDAVNSIVSVQEKLIDSRFVVETKHEEPADPYAEQRKWIGKLCWFWNNDNEPDTCFGVLTGLFDEADRPFERSIGQQLYRYCEPVKPDSELIYHGE